MRVLVVEQLVSGPAAETESSGSNSGAIEDLMEGGHEVVRCRTAGDDGFLCDGMPGRPGCPLETDEVDVAVSVRHSPGPAGPGEDGVRCALRRHVPLVLAGEASGAPWAGMVAVEAGEGQSLSAAVRRAGEKPLLRHSALARAALSETLDRAGLPTSGASATAHRSGSRVRVELRADVALDSRLVQAAAVRAVAAIRAVDSTATGVDVALADCRDEAEAT